MKRWFVVILWMLACLSIAISVTVLISPIVYRLFVSYTDLVEISELSQAQLQANYDVMWRYVVNPFAVSFQFPNFTMSQGGVQHFVDVQRLISLNSAMSILGVVVLMLSKWWASRTERYIESPMLMVMLGLPVVMIMFFMTMFEPLFIAFHRLFFSNELWLFDPATDPIITVLPATFFLTLFVIGAIVYELLLIVLYVTVTKRTSERLQ